MLNTFRRWRHPAMMILLLIVVAAVGYRTWHRGQAPAEPRHETPAMKPR